MTPTQLIAWRVQNNMSQQALATHLKLSVRTLARYEKGERPIPASLHATIGTFKESAFGTMEEDPRITFNTHPHLYEPWKAKNGAVRLPTHPDYGKPKGLGSRASALATYVPPTPAELAAAKCHSFGDYIQAQAYGDDE
jgi:transcriptional regulator with XRE-family HTH domain